MAGLKFRILLDSAKDQEIFRDILISDETNFEVFYTSILESYNFKGDQMASFYISNDDWDRGQEITITDMSFGEDPEPPLIMSKEVIKNFIEQPDQKIILVHDFMRMWIFLIELIGYTKDNPEQPSTILAVGDAPKEDSRTAEDNDDLFLGDIEEDDEFGFDDFDDDYSDEDYSSFDDYEY